MHVLRSDQGLDELNIEQKGFADGSDVGRGSQGVKDRSWDANTHKKHLGLHLDGWKVKVDHSHGHLFWKEP